MKRNRNELFLSLLGIISLILITVGVTYAFFNYAKEGTTENTITTGSITFIYEEVDKQGAGISIENAFPVSDEVGKAQSETGEVFNFKVKSQSGNFDIPYTVTARMSSDSTLDQKAVKVYLTEVVGDTETALIESIYEDLTDYTNAPEGKVEKVLYTDTVEAKVGEYEKNFRLRMWIPDSIDFSPVQDESGNDTYPYNGKKFTLTVNVYANAEVITEEVITKVAYNIGDSVTLTDGSKWHVLEESSEDSDTVVLLSDYNLNSDGSYNTECGSNINSTYVCSPMAFDSDNTNTYDETDSNNIGYFIKNTYSPLVLEELPEATNITLPTASQIASADGQTLTDPPMSITTTWLLTTNYWTQTPRSGFTYVNLIVGGLNSYIRWNQSNGTTDYGARPTITVPKKYIVSKLSEIILIDNTLVEAEPTLTTSSNNTTDASGLYKSTATNDGSPTYYFRGNIDNNYVEFAGFTWRIVRINEDGTIRLIMQDGINNNATYAFNSNYNNKTYMYYTNNSNAKTQLEAWYQNNIVDKGYSDSAISGNYFCEQAKVAVDSTSATSSGADMVVYTDYKEADFKCEKDTNGYGVVNASIGLVTYDEVLHAGGYCNKTNSSYYLANGTIYW